MEIRLDEQFLIIKPFYDNVYDDFAINMLRENEINGFLNFRNVIN